MAYKSLKELQRCAKDLGKDAQNDVPFQSEQEKFECECKVYCDANGIGILAEEDLNKCLAMPIEGIKVKRYQYDDWYYPICGFTSFNSKVAENIGLFSVKNGVVVFIYRDGKTYLAKGMWVVEKLLACGFKEGSLFVPLATGEQIQNETVRKYWEILPNS